MPREDGAGLWELDWERGQRFLQCAEDFPVEQQVWNIKPALVLGKGSKPGAEAFHFQRV